MLFVRRPKPSDRVSWCFPVLWTRCVACRLEFVFRFMWHWKWRQAPGGWCQEDAVCRRCAPNRDAAERALREHSENKIPEPTRSPFGKPQAVVRHGPSRRQAAGAHRAKG